MDVMPMRFLRLASLNGGSYIAPEKEYEPGKMELPDGSIIQKAAVFGTVMELVETEKLSRATIDDCTAEIALLAFNEDKARLSGLAKGDIIFAVGKPRERDGEVFIAVESAKKIAFSGEMMYRAMCLKQAKTGTGKVNKTFDEQGIKAEEESEFTAADKFGPKVSKSRI